MVRASSISVTGNVKTTTKLMFPCCFEVLLISFSFLFQEIPAGPSLTKTNLETLKIGFFAKAVFYNSGWNLGALEVSMVTALTVRRHRNIFSRDVVLHGIERSTFQHFPANWPFKVVEMAIKTIHVVQGLSGTPLLFIPRYLTNIFSKIVSKQKTSR